MAGRSALLTASGTRKLLSWVQREDGADPFEVAVGSGYLPDATPEALARDGVPIQWCGQAAVALGLQGEATSAAASRVLTHGVGPHGEALRTRIQAIPQKNAKTGELIPQSRRDTAGWVLTASKTVSLLLISDQPAVRQAVAHAIDQASTVAIRELEQQVTVRRKAQGVRSEGIQGLVGIKAYHYTSSAGDPHLHVHFILNNSAPAASDGKWRALDGNIFFASQRIAEAAFQATLKADLTARLQLDESAWTAQRVGGVTTWELTALVPAVERFSRATAHMQDLAKKILLTLDGATHHEHAWIWAQHRQDKRALAEALEHAMDAAIAQGGEASEALRGEWRHWFGPERQALEAITPRPHPQSLPETHESTERVLGALNGTNATQREAAITQADHTAAQAQIALDHFREDARNVLYQKGAQAVPQDVLQALDESIQDAQQRPFGFLRRFSWWDHSARLSDLRQTKEDYLTWNRLWSANAQAQQHAQTVRQQAGHAADVDHTVLQSLRVLAVELGDTLGPFIAADLAAYWRSTVNVSLDDTRRLTAATLRWWHDEGLIHVPEGTDCTAYFTTIEHGLNPETKIHTQTWGHHGKIVSDPLLQRELALYQQATDLSQAQRRPLAVDITGLTPDQARAASTIAQGKALTTIQGVAGAGKTHMMHPIVAAAKAQGMPVKVLARNAKLAKELGNELGVSSSTLAKWTHRQSAAPGPTLIILDEAGLVDQADWQAVLQGAQDDPLQVVALGDRHQAQPIDRLATWAVVTSATQPHAAYAELTRTFRNQAWADEAGALRRGQDVSVESAHAAQRIWPAPEGHGAEAAAALVLQLMARGEDALGIAATNEDTAALIGSSARGFTEIGRKAPAFRRGDISPLAR